MLVDCELLPATFTGVFPIVPETPPLMLLDLDDCELQLVPPFTQFVLCEFEFLNPPLTCVPPTLAPPLAAKLLDLEVCVLPKASVEELCEFPPWNPPLKFWPFALPLKLFELEFEDAHLFPWQFTLEFCWF